MVKKGLVYILDYPEMNNITTMPDITDLNSKDQRQMKSSTSPIAIFVITRWVFLQKTWT